MWSAIPYRVPAGPVAVMGGLDRNGKDRGSVVATNSVVTGGGNRGRGPNRCPTEVPLGFVGGHALSALTDVAIRDAAGSARQPCDRALSFVLRLSGPCASASGLAQAIVASAPRRAYPHVAEPRPIGVSTAVQYCRYRSKLFCRGFFGSEYDAIAP